MQPEWYDDEGMYQPRPRVPGTRPGMGPAPKPGVEQTPAVLEEDLITLWAHDLTAKPGEIYRYRVRVALVNPLFQQTQLVPEQRQKYANELSVLSEPSAWTQPVRVDPEHYYFATAVDAGVTTVEVWRIFGGAWRSQEFKARPGQSIGEVVTVDVEGRPMTVDMRIGAILVDAITSGDGIGGMRDAQVLLLEAATDRLVSRFTGSDRTNQDRIRLRNEAVIFGTTPGPTAGLIPQ
jgi:hypothetical protein